MYTELISLAILLVLSAFFSATEVAFLSLTDARVDVMMKRRLPKAKLVKKLKKKSRRLLVTILVGNNVVNIAAASLATVTMTKFFDSAVVGITTGVMTLLVLIFGEIIPKSYAANHAKRFAIFSAPVLYGLQIAILPVIIIFEGFTNVLTGEHNPDSVSEEEVKALASAGKRQGVIEKDEASMIHRLFEMNDITAEDIMTPRVQVEYIKEDVSIAEAADVIANSSHTRFPVVHDDLDEIVGLLHSRDVLLAYNKDKESGLIKKIVRPIIKVPKQMRIDDLMREFQKKHTHMAVIMDEYGGTDGIATLEDVIEELVGEIVDEYDVDEDLIKRIDKNTIIAAGEANLRDINDFFNINLPGDPLDSIAEVILEKIQKLPKKRMDIEFDEVRCVIEEVEKKAISRVRIIKS